MDTLSPDLYRHSLRLKSYAAAFASYLNLYSSRDLLLSAWLHDLGKLKINPHILSKPGRLSDTEWAQIKKHHVLSYSMITHVSPGLGPLVLCHHVRWDGQGYPLGLFGTDISFLSRILSILDAFDAMTNDRPYRKSITYQETLEEIQLCAGTQFDPDLVNKFVLFSL